MMTSEPSRPTLSVVIPFYDVEDYIEACLVSVRDQVLDDIEVILVDDGSHDASRDVAERFVASDSRFHLVSQDNAGLGEARNTGIRHSRGIYLTFVDSDDVVAPFGFSRLVASLERTGSDFAAGNARRFTSARGSYPSWTHIEPFSRDAERVTLAQRPGLVADRMIWNKVFRRSFWDANALVFPAIRYEDYPVTMAAYLDAAAVDVISQPVYYWRDRESGTSITQQASDVANARDRYASACLVLDALDSHPDAPADARRLAHTYLVRVDLVALTTAVSACDAASRQELEPLVRRLARRLYPDPSAAQTQVARLVHGAWVRDEAAVAEAVARWSSGGGAKQLGRDLVAQRSVSALARVGSAVAASRLPTNLNGVRILKAHTTALRVSGTVLEIDADVTLRQALAQRAQACARLVGSDGRMTTVPVALARPERNTTRVTIRVDVRDVRSSDAALEMRLALPGGVMRWAGPLTADADTLVAPIILPDGGIVVVRAVARLTLERLDPERCAIARVQPEEEGFSIRVDAGHRADGGVGAASIVLERPEGLTDLELGRVNHRFVLPFEVARKDAADDPIMGSASRRLRCWNHDGEEIDLLLDGDAAEVSHGGIRQRLERGSDGTLRVAMHGLSPTIRNSAEDRHCV